MAEPNQPKKETVRITLPPQPVAAGAGSDHDTVKIDPPSGGSAMETPRSAPAATPRTAATSAQKPAPPPPGPSVLPPGRIVPAPPPAAHSASPQPPTPKTPTPRPPVPGIAAAPA